MIDLSLQRAGRILASTESELAGALISNNAISDASIRSNLIIDVVLGALLMIGFCLLQRSSILYRFRLVSPSVTFKPPALPKGGWSSVFGWIAVTLKTKDLELLKSCGLDALMMVKIMALGFQLFLPFTILGLCVLFPLHLAGNYLTSTAMIMNSSVFMKFTISNMPEEDVLLWVHFVLVHLYVLYGCWLLKWHYQQYVVLRQHFLRRGEDANQWRLLYEAPQNHPSSRLRQLWTMLPIVRELVENQVPIHEDDEEPLSEPDEPDQPEIVPLTSPGTRQRTQSSVLQPRPPGSVRMQPSAPTRTRHTIHATTTGVSRVNSRDGTFDTPRQHPWDAATTSQADPHRLLASGVEMSANIAFPGHGTGGRHSLNGPPSNGPATMLFSMGGGKPTSPLAGAATPPMVIARDHNSRRHPSPPGLGDVGRIQEQLAPGGFDLLGDAVPAFTSSSVVASSVNDDSRQLQPMYSMHGRLARLAAFQRLISNELHNGDQVDSTAITLEMSPLETPTPARAPTAGLPLLSWDDEEIMLHTAPPVAAQAPTAGCSPVPGNPSTNAQALTVAQKTAASGDVHLHIAGPSTGTGGAKGSSHTTQKEVRQVSKSIAVSSTLQSAPPRNGAAPGAGDVEQGGDKSGEGSQDDEDPTTEMPRWWGKVQVRHRPNGSTGDGLPYPVKASGQAEGSTRSRHVRGASWGYTLPGLSTAVKHISHSRNPSQNADFFYTNEAAIAAPLEAVDVAWSHPRRSVWRVVAMDAEEPHPEIEPHPAPRLRPSNEPTVASLSVLPPPVDSGLMQESEGRLDLLAMPSVRFRKTVNTVDTRGESVAVNAQQYAVLVTDVLQPASDDQPRRGNASWMGVLVSWLSGSTNSVARKTRRTSNTVHSNASTTRFREGQCLSPAAGSPASITPSLQGHSYQRRSFQQTSVSSLASSIQTVKQTVQGGRRQQRLLEAGSNDSDQAVAGMLDVLLSPRDMGSSSVITPLPPPKAKSQPLRPNSGLLHTNDAYGQTPPVSARSSSGQVALQPAAQVSLPHLPGASPFGGRLAQHTVANNWNRSETEGLSIAQHPGEGKDNSGPLGSVMEPVSSVPFGSQTDHGASGSAAAPSSQCVARTNGEVEGQGRGKAGWKRAGGQQQGDGAWDVVRAHVRSGAVRQLIYNKRYSVVTATFARIFPLDFDRAIPVVRHKEVDLLLVKQDEHLGSYEQAQLYLRKRGRRQKERLGWLGLCGQQVDCIDHHKAKLVELRNLILKARRHALEHQVTSSWFVFFKSQLAASIAAVAPIHAEDNHQFHVRPAPGPDEVNWGALWLTWQNREVRGWLLYPVMLLLVLVPVGIFAGGLQQLDFIFCPVHKCLLTDSVTSAIDGTVTNSTYIYRGIVDQPDCLNMNGTVVDNSNSFQWDWYCEQDSILAQVLSFFVVGWLPSLLLIIWQAGILPAWLLAFTNMSGACFSLVQVDRRIATFLFHFAVWNVFLGGMAGSALVQQINQSFQMGPMDVFYLMGTSLPTSSNFFMNYMLFRTLVGIPARLVIPHVGVRMFLLRRYFRCVPELTERDKALLYAPVSPRYGYEYGMVTIVFLVGTAFSVVSPLLMPLVLVFFCLAWLFWRYSLLYVYVRKYESGGLLWQFLFHRVVVCLYIMSLFTACVLVVKKAYVQAILMFITIPVILFRFTRHCYHRFQASSLGVPLETAAQAPKAHIDPWVYIPPPLHHRALGWNPDWNKPWQGWGMPPGYATL